MRPYYEDDLVTLYHGDCLEVLGGIGMGINRPSILVTDPPYTAAGGSTNGRSGDADDQFFRFWMASVTERIRAAMLPESRGFVFSDWRTVNLIAAAFRDPGSRMSSSGGWSSRQALVWDREGIGMGAPFRNSFEMIVVVSGPDADWNHMPRNIPTVIRHRWPYGASEFHGAEKPVELCKRLTVWACGPEVPGRVVLDPFAGSGTTLVAARALGLRSIGIEIEERNCEMAVKRLSQNVLDLGGAA